MRQKTIITLLTIACILILTSCSHQISEEAQTIINDINSIGNISLEKEETISDIWERYYNLPEEERKYVTNYDILKDAKSELNRLANLTNNDTSFSQNDIVDKATDESIENAESISTAKWIDTEYKDTKTSELRYQEPVSWKKTLKTNPKRIFYYPYDDIDYGFVYLEETPISSKEEVDLEKILVDLAGSNDNVTLMESVTIDTIEGKRAIEYLSIGGINNYQSIEYLVYYSGKIYRIAFTNITQLQPEMIEYANTFISNVKFADSNDTKPDKVQVENISEMENSDNIASDENTQQSGYQAIYDEYSKKISEAVPGLIEEYNSAAAGISDMQTLATLSNQCVGKLAEICNDGVGKMAKHMYKINDTYENYEAWSMKLMDVYTKEASKITDAYLK